MKFSDLGLSDELSQAVAELGYESPTPIQEKSIPIILMGRDILGSAQTGTGKTASFTLPMIDILASGRAKARMPRSLILAPTRELAAQVAESFEKFSTHHKLNMALLIGGVSFSDQNTALDKGVDVLIATPGRLLDHFERGKVMLNDVKVLVIDEADRMLDMGFIPDVERIVSLLPPLRQTLFFSATLSDDIHKISHKFVSNPKIIEVAPPASTADTVAQHLQWTDVKSKRAVLRDLLRVETVKNAVIFCNRKRDISTLVKSLTKHEFSAVAMHGDMTQSARLEALDKFKKGEVPLLIASDVAARGLDIAGLSHVFNFDVPMNAEDYVHRIGRTGRAGKSGRAFTIAAGKDDKRYISAIESLIGKTIPLVGDAGDDASETKTSTAKDTDKKPAGRGKKPAAKEADKVSTKADKKPASSTKPKDHNTKEPRQKNRNGNTKDELPSPPDCQGDTLEATGHIPAFLRR
ncbi:DEAD/DEAH box helicase [Candidatus Puniceispirillum marinum]|uniref:DEAD-box ATP-dependent RNA helicase RhpA n=1 Tax=Puniceispirillum marinum (strain IMCC1322) TaxID=488538 RepID=D5BNS7_PUNMI|nr:DEAD/DEAH box helicase [Candidatus Puniceispirillum marinum]ADE38344.1 Superfamily II DNA and RNA helicase [Candidatus Puniceispirillum marinum IMCC1322]